MPRPKSASERVDLGTDTSGRRIVVTRRMKAAYDAVVRECGVAPVIVQGAFMAEFGGGAKESASYHDRAGCIDTRTWNLTADEQESVIRCARRVGWAVWKRDAAHGGMDEHMHWVLIDEPDMSDGAVQQVRAYLDGLDGLASGGKDYHWRPDPIPTFDLDSFQEDDMPTMQELKDELVPVIVNQIMKRNIDTKGMTVARALRQGSKADDVLALLKDLPDEVASAVGEEIPDGDGTMSKAQIKAAAKAGAQMAVSRVLSKLEELDEDDEPVEV